MKYTFKKYWVCVGKNLFPEYSSMAGYKKVSIDLIEKKFSGTGLKWQDLKKYGWKCIKVNVTFEEAQ
jgi:hypothetical protein